MEIFTLIVSIMGGGVIVGVMEWIRSVWSAKKEQKISFLDKQIRELYGPLNYFVCQTSSNAVNVVKAMPNRKII